MGKKQNSQKDIKKSLAVNYKLFTALVILGVALLTVVASSYGLWVATFHQTSSNKITTDCFKIEFTELTNSISLTNTYPISDEKGLKTTPYSFKIKNTCETKAEYLVTLNTLSVSGNKIPDNLIKYVFYESTASVSVGSYLSNATKNTDTSNIKTSSAIVTSYKMASGTLAKNEEKTYMLKLWIDSSATTAINGYKFASSVNVVSYATS